MSADPIKALNHYARFILENDLSYWQGNITKDVCRYDVKNGVDDLNKARQYRDMQIKRMEGEAGWLG